MSSLDVLDCAPDQESGARFPFFLPKDSPVDTEADFVIKVLRPIYKETRKGLMFILEALIVESTFHARPAGMTCSFLQPFTREPEVAVRTAKEFMMAALGLGSGHPIYAAVNPRSPEMLKRMCGEANPLMHEFLRLHVNVDLTKEKKTPFTYHRFSPVEKTDEQITASLNKLFAADIAANPVARPQRPQAPVGAYPAYPGAPPQGAPQYPPGPPQGYGAPPPQYPPPAAPHGVGGYAPPQAPGYGAPPPAPGGWAPPQAPGGYAPPAGPPPQAAPPPMAPPPAGNAPKWSPTRGCWIGVGDPEYVMLPVAQ